MTESIDSKQMVKNLCISQRYHPWDHFLTFTCNQKTHFGVSPLRNWIDSGRWKNFYNNFYILDDDEQLEITASLFQSSAVLMLRAWEEVFSLFLNYLRKSKSSPFKHLTTIFSRKEYQKDKGNLSHAHMMIRLNWDVMSADERKFVDNIIRASVCDIIRADEIEKYIDHGLMKSHHDIFEVMEDATMFLSHKCSDRCLVKTLDGNLRCRKLDNLKVSKDNTRHEFMSLPNFFSVECSRILDKIGFMEEIVLDSDENNKVLKSSLLFFHPKQHIPPTNPTNNLNMSPVDGYFFTAFRSM